jgi:uncharacterized protein YbaP (TraB family)
MRKFSNYLIGVVLLGITFAASASDKGLFWKLESPTGVTSYLFGTMHSDDNRVADITPITIEAIKAVDTFVMEVAENRDPSLFMLKSGSLASQLTNDEFEKVRELADFHTMHLGAALQMKPWLLAVVFDLPKPQTPFAQDNMLMTKAEENLKDVVGIETPQEHFAVMDDFNLEEQMVMLRAVLKRTQEQKEADFERLMKAYLDGDVSKIVGLDEQITGGMLPKDLWAKMKERLLDRRNKVMAERAIQMAGEKPVFIAVGASHLGGETGLIQAFKKAGYKLSPVAK